MTDQDRIEMKQEAADRAASCIRECMALLRKIGSLLEQFTPQECENYLRNSGYGST